MLRERSSDTAYYMEHSVCSNFKMYSALILVFSLATINPKRVCKNQFFLKF